MKIGIVKERREGERRCAVSPDTVKKYVGLGAQVAIESGAGLSAAITDEAFKAAGAEIVGDAAAALSGADLVLKVQRPDSNELGAMKRGAVLAAILNPYNDKASIADYATRGIDAMAMELVPRITRAQAMDVLSSQANLAGSRAEIDAAAEYGRAFPMKMTAAGTVPAAKVIIIGVG